MVREFLGIDRSEDGEGRAPISDIVESFGFPRQNTKPCPVFQLMDTYCELACFGGVQQIIEFDVSVRPNFTLNGVRDRIVQGQSRRS